MKKITALIPMKGHSERVPGKNLRKLNGKPLFYWIIRELLICADSVCVDTDSEEIISSVKSHFDNVSFILRPKELRGDAVSMNRILENDISQLNCEHFIQAHSTGPLLTANTISGAIKTYFSNLNEYDSLYSVSAVQARCFTSDGKPVNHNPDELIQTQYLKPVLVENSGFYIFSKKSFAKNKRRIGEKPYLYPIDQYEAIDIDNENDFAAAEALCAAWKVN
ncbi:MAG: acylneuraminate cytidylyltransferase family protein [Clostridiales bacterium]|jgi:CMP-N-acetylneuraminic acid synthetase|nr:acylneuraminate cytidylyltransferase family protein [Clostridiales bacterium]